MLPFSVQVKDAHGCTPRELVPHQSAAVITASLGVASLYSGDFDSSEIDAGSRGDYYTTQPVIPAAATAIAASASAAPTSGSTGAIIHGVTIGFRDDESFSVRSGEMERGLVQPSSTNDDLREHVMGDTGSVAGYGSVGTGSHGGSRSYFEPTESNLGGYLGGPLSSEVSAAVGGNDVLSDSFVPFLTADTTWSRYTYETDDMVAQRLGDAYSVSTQASASAEHFTIVKLLNKVRVEIEEV